MDQDMQQVLLPYRHTQVGAVTLIGSSVGLLTQLARTVQALRKHRRWAWISVVRTAGLVGVMAIFASLRVEVDDTIVTASFTCGALPRRISLAEIEAAKVVTVPWYHGWGLRKTQAGWMYNVSGRRAVELDLSEERTFTIGSDQPEALLAAIEQARALRAPATA